MPQRDMSSSASTPWLESSSSASPHPPPPSSSSSSSFAAAFAVNATTVAVGINAAANSSGGGASSPYEMGAKFNPSMAIIIVVLLSTFFFMGFLSIYVKKCVTTEGDMEHLHIPWTLDHRGGGSSSWPQQPQGLDKAAIQALPIVSSSTSLSSSSSSSSGCTRGSVAAAAGSNKECCVCLGEFQENDRLRLLPKCGHTFHIECIDMWLFSHTTCPLCRFRLTPDNVVADSAAVALELLQQHQRDHQREQHQEEPELQIHIHQQQQQQQSEISITIATTTDVEEQQAEDHEHGMNNTQECFDASAEMKLPEFLLKVWDLIRCWRLGLGARIGHVIFT